VTPSCMRCGLYATCKPLGASVAYVMTLTQYNFLDCTAPPIGVVLCEYLAAHCQWYVPKEESAK
jgi:uncharacterized membrane protein YeiH